MSEPIIRVENLGKCYRIHHESRERYTALRDVIAHKVKGLFHPGATIERAASSDEYFWALKDLNFKVQPGEVVGIIGRNGAGKSTLLKVLSRITEPTKGRVTLNGRVASLLEVGTGFHPELTGRENIFLNGAILGMSKLEIKAKFDEIVDFAEVERFLDTPVKRYSSGMYVRLAFAVAAHLEPEILIIDEVLAVGDAKFQQRCLGKISSVARSGRTIFFVSHSMQAITTLCHRVITLRDGCVVGDGPAQAQVADYLAHERVQMHQPSATSFPVGEHLTIHELKWIPNAVLSGDALAFSFLLKGERPEIIYDLSLIFNSAMGTRAAVIDLRTSCLNGNDGEALPFRIDGVIPAISLVEGRYDVSMYIRTSTFTGEIMNIAALAVQPWPVIGDVIPYDPIYRGFASLGFSAHCTKI